MRRLTQEFLAVLNDFFRNNCHYMAAGIAYWTLLSLFPLALAGVSVMGYLSLNQASREGVVNGVAAVVPVSREYLLGLMDQIVAARGAIGWVATFSLAWSGMAVFSAIRKGINHAWHIGDPGGFLHERAIDASMLVGICAFAGFHAVFVSDLFGLSFKGVVGTVIASPGVLKLTGDIVTLAMTFAAFAMLYRFVPHTRVTWREAWGGALFGACVFQAVAWGLAWYLSQFDSLNLVYGPIGAVVAILIWAYLSSLAVMWGAQVAYSVRLAGEAQAPPGETVRSPAPNIGPPGSADEIRTPC